ncbi:hypothetical protein [Bacillus massilinigeriensis]|uniref:hypothetical protein n=1 Tax=Bacillus mediterraneensis TaxID=1805474 RepID=UPI0008F7F539|nr:hypothetical protein [Bacillus mediterraneensis]
METILPLGGNVQYKITLDPGVWIFDDRKVDLDTYFHSSKDRLNALEEYTKDISAHWDREIAEGSVFPPTLKSEKKFEKQKMMTGTFGIPFEPFLQNAKPHEKAEKLIIQHGGDSTTILLSEAKKLVLAFSKCGKPLKEDGPVHVYFGDGSNFDSPIKHVNGFIVE